MVRGPHVGSVPGESCWRAEPGARATGHAGAGEPPRRGPARTEPGGQGASRRSRSAPAIASRSHRSTRRASPFTSVLVCWASSREKSSTGAGSDCPVRASQSDKRSKRGSPRSIPSRSRPSSRCVVYGPIQQTKLTRCQGYRWGALVCILWTARKLFVRLSKVGASILFPLMACPSECAQPLSGLPLSSGCASRASTDLAAEYGSPLRRSPGSRVKTLPQGHRDQCFGGSPSLGRSGCRCRDCQPLAESRLGPEARAAVVGGRHPRRSCGGGVAC